MNSELTNSVLMLMSYNFIFFLPEKINVSSCWFLHIPHKKLQKKKKKKQEDSQYR